MPQRNRYTPESLAAAISASATWADVARRFGISQTGGAKGHIQKLAKRWGIDTPHFTGQAWNKGGESLVRWPRTFTGSVTPL
jgi:transposase-like protein